MTTAANNGQKALDSKDYPAAITHYTRAINSTVSSPVSPLWLIQRSTAYQRTGAYARALKDAEHAHQSATARGRKELIATAHFRRAVAYYGLGEYGNARMCLIWTRQFNENERGLGMWQAKVAADWEKAGGEAAECNKVTAVEKPVYTESEDIDEIKQQTGKEENKSKGNGKGKEVVREESGAAVAKPVAAAVKPATTAYDNIRVEWYQTGTSVTIEILCKGIPKERTTVKFEEGQLLVKFPVEASNCDYEYSATPLHQKIDAEKSSFRITPHKLEITLVKQDQGRKWSEIYPAPEDTQPEEPLVWTKAQLKELALKAEEASAANPLTPAEEEALRAHYGVKPGEPLPRPRHPFHPGVDWDKVVTKSEDDDEDLDPMQSFFQKIYKNATPDSQRAMLKSYQESNGTSLNTVWDDVKDAPVETHPPNGMVAKKW